MALRWCVLVAGQRDRFARPNPFSNSGYRLASVREVLAFVPIEQDVVVSLDLQALSLNRIDPKFWQVFVADANPDAAMSESPLRKTVLSAERIPSDVTKHCNARLQEEIQVALELNFYRRTSTPAAFTGRASSIPRSAASLFNSLAAISLRVASYGKRLYVSATRASPLSCPIARTAFVMALWSMALAARRPTSLTAQKFSSS